MYGHNSRLDSLHAVIGNRLINEVEDITNKRIANAKKLDKAFEELNDYISIPERKENVKQVYHTYVVRVKDRDRLHRHLMDKGIEAKVHYPIPMHLQKASDYLGYKEGDFPLCEEDSRTIITLPVHQHLTEEALEYMIEQIRAFYLDK